MEDLENRYRRYLIYAYIMIICTDIYKSIHNTNTNTNYYIYETRFPIACAKAKRVFLALERYAKQLTETGPTFAQKATEELSQFKGDWRAQQAAAGSAASDRHHRAVTARASHAKGGSIYHIDREYIYIHIYCVYMYIYVYMV